MNDKIRLLKNVAVVILIAIPIFFVYRYFTSDAEEELTIAETPIHIESIRTIAEISVVSYKDEVVMDSVERYTGELSGYDPRDWPAMYNRKVKRRLTLIVKGEVHYGLNLTNGNFKIDQSSQDTILLHLPKPEITDVIITPLKTEVFQEQGVWTDRERKVLENQAKHKLIENSENLKLEVKAEKNAELLFKKMIHTHKKLIISFD